MITNQSMIHESIYESQSNSNREQAKNRGETILESRVTPVKVL